MQNAQQHPCPRAGRQPRAAARRASPAACTRTPRSRGTPHLRCSRAHARSAGAASTSRRTPIPLQRRRVRAWSARNRRKMRAAAASRSRGTWINTQPAYVRAQVSRRVLVASRVSPSITPSVRSAVSQGDARVLSGVRRGRRREHSSAVPPRTLPPSPSQVQHFAVGCFAVGRTPLFNASTEA